MRRAPVKSVLLDQRVVAGLGNIYADEALWRARVNPLRPAASLDPDEVRRVHRAIRAALRAGIERQGSTLSDYRTPEGSRGGMQEEFRVYGRDGLPCRRCGTTIVEDARRRARHLVLPSLPALGLACTATGRRSDVGTRPT